MSFTRTLMTASAAFLAVLGLAASFGPDEVLRAIDAPALPMLLLIVQVLGATYIALAVLNWMSRNNLVGGIYSRPVALTNLLHFMTAGLAMMKAASRSTLPGIALIVMAAYVVFAISFAVVLFRHPIREAAPEA
jgi:hypothetical protein